jgi:hypothetical protein
MIRRFCIVAVGVASALMIFANVSISAPLGPSLSVIARGRALVVFGTYNDCHTPGWRDADGSIAVGRWMTGSSVGFRGWWGTSYPTNERLDFQEMTEERWLLAARTRAGHPPMIWQDIRGATRCRYSRNLSVHQIAGPHRCSGTGRHSTVARTDDFVHRHAFAASTGP